MSSPIRRSPTRCTLGCPRNYPAPRPPTARAAPRTPSIRLHKRRGTGVSCRPVPCGLRASRSMASSSLVEQTLAERTAPWGRWRAPIAAGQKAPEVRNAHGPSTCILECILSCMDTCMHVCGCLAYVYVILGPQVIGGGDVSFPRNGLAAKNSSCCLRGNLAIPHGL